MTPGISGVKSLGHVGKKIVSKLNLVSASSFSEIDFSVYTSLRLGDILTVS